MNINSYEFKGLAECDEALRRLSADIAMKWVNGALLAGAKVIKATEKQEVPVATGALQANVRIGRGRTFDGNRRDYYVNVGGRRPSDPFYSVMVEKGTQAHIIRASKGSALSFGGVLRSSVMHPGAKANPFAERAFDSAGLRAVDAFRSYIQDKLARAGVLQPNAETE